MSFDASSLCATSSTSSPCRWESALTPRAATPDAPDFHARAFAGRRFVGARWAYFAFIINWYAQVLRAINRTLALVKHSLTREHPQRARTIVLQAHQAQVIHPAFIAHR